MKTRTIAWAMALTLTMALGAAGAQPPPPAPPAPPAAPKPAPAPKAAPASWDSTGQTDRITRTIKVSDPSSLILSNVAGDIVVSGTSRGEIHIEAVKRAKAGDPAEVKRQLDSTTIEIEERTGRVEVRTRYTDGQHKHSWVSVDYTVTVPPTAGVELRSVSGDVTITGVSGEVSVETVSGSVTASNLGPRVSLKAVSGDVNVSATSGDGELVANSVSGDVSVKGYKARTVEAQSVSGNVKFTEGKCERATASSVSGDIELAGAVVKGGRYELKSHSGDVRLVVDGSVGFELEARTFSGDIQTEPFIKSEKSGDWPRQKSVRGVFGDGSAQVSLASFSGDIVLVKK